MFIPEPHVEDKDLHSRADGRFGTADCFQWPQPYCKEYEYVVCIPHEEHHPHPDPIAWAWYMPQAGDIDLLPTSALAVGRFKEDKARVMSNLHEVAERRYESWKKNRGEKQDIISKMLQRLQHTKIVLLYHPLTLRNLIAFVAQAQRIFLDIITFLDFVEVVLPCLAYPGSVPHAVWSDWMGCFTTNAQVCNELFQAGVPVWYVRATFTITENTIIKRVITFSFPDHILRAEYFEQGKSVQPFDTLYKGPGGFHRHVHSCRYYMGTAQPTLESNPESMQESSHAGKVPTHAQSRKAAQKVNQLRPQGHLAKSKYSTLSLLASGSN